MGPKMSYYYGLLTLLAAKIGLLTAPTVLLTLKWALFCSKMGLNGAQNGSDEG